MNRQLAYIMAPIMPPIMPPTTITTFIHIDGTITKTL